MVGIVDRWIAARTVEIVDMMIKNTKLGEKIVERDVLGAYEVIGKCYKDGNALIFAMRTTDTDFIDCMVYRSHIDHEDCLNDSDFTEELHNGVLYLRQYLYGLKEISREKFNQTVLNYLNSIQLIINRQ